jgi:hypothetical protein
MGISRWLADTEKPIDLATSGLPAVENSVLLWVFGVSVTSPLLTLSPKEADAFSIRDRSHLPEVRPNRFVVSKLVEHCCSSLMVPVDPDSEETLRMLPVSDHDSAAGLHLWLIRATCSVWRLCRYSFVSTSDR